MSVVRTEQNRFLFPIVTVLQCTLIHVIPSVLLDSEHFLQLRENSLRGQGLSGPVHCAAIQKKRP